MKIDIQALSTFNRLAHEGATRAATSLGELSDVPLSVECTSITLVDPRDLADDLSGDGHIGISIGFEGGFHGRMMLIMDDWCLQQLLEPIPDDSGQPIDDNDRIKQIGTLVLEGFLDGWADHLGTSFDSIPPEVSVGSDAIPNELLLPDNRHQVFAFTSNFAIGDTRLTASVFMLPDLESFDRLVDSQFPGISTIPLEQLTVFQRMTRLGARKASDHMTEMSGIETAVEISKLTFTPIRNVTSHVKDNRYIGVVVELSGGLSGYVAILFDKQSAYRLASRLVPFEDEDFGSIHRSAIQEVGNIMTSGFIDGWANVLETSIDISIPKYVSDTGQVIIEPLVLQLAETQDFALLIDSGIETMEHNVTCEIYAIPDEEKMTKALNEMPTRSTKIG